MTFRREKTFLRMPQESYLDWLKKGKAKPLKAEPTIKIRTKQEQIPESKSDLEMIKTKYMTTMPIHTTSKCVQLKL